MILRQKILYFQIKRDIKEKEGYLEPNTILAKIDMEYFKERLEKWIIPKIDKRKSFSQKHPDIPYIISIVSREKLLWEVDVKEILEYEYETNKKFEEISGILFKYLEDNFVYYPNKNSSLKLEMI